MVECVGVRDVLERQPARPSDDVAVGWLHVAVGAAVDALELLDEVIDCELTQVQHSRASSAHTRRPAIGRRACSHEHNYYAFDSPPADGVPGMVEQKWASVNGQLCPGARKRRGCVITVRLQTAVVCKTI